MGVGMVCIFLVIGVIAFLTYLLNKATAPRTPTPGDDEDTDE